MTFETVYDVSQQGYESWWFPAVGLFGVVAFSLLSVAPKTANSRLHAIQRQHRWLLVFSVIWIVAAFYFTYSDYAAATAALSSGNYRLVDGRVSDVVRERKGAPESFLVGTVRFSYSEYAIHSGFRGLAAQGGPIREGSYVRIAYNADRILRLEVVR